MEQEQIKQPLAFEISVIVTQRNQQPCLELRRVTTDNELIKQIISAAFHQKPLIFLPVFKDKIKSIGSLIDKGIIYFDSEKEEYYYTV